MRRLLVWALLPVAAGCMKATDKGVKTNDLALNFSVIPVGSSVECYAYFTKKSDPYALQVSLEEGPMATCNQEPMIRYGDSFYSAPMDNAASFTIRVFRPLDGSTFVDTYP